MGVNKTRAERTRRYTCLSFDDGDGDDGDDDGDECRWGGEYTGKEKEKIKKIK